MAGPQARRKMRPTETKLEDTGKCNLGRASRRRRKNKSLGVLVAGEMVGHHDSSLTSHQALCCLFFIFTISPLQGRPNPLSFFEKS